MFFSFHILVFHCINHLNYKSKIIKVILSNVNIDLATFFIISFYFSYNSLISRNILKIKQRINRLLIPYIIWPIIFYGIQNFINKISANKLIEFKLLYYQYILGHGIHIVFWFQFHLIFLYIFYSIIILMTKKYLCYLLLIGILCYFFIIKYYFEFFQKYNMIVAFSTKRMPFSYIYSLTGFSLFSIRIYDKISNNKVIIIYIFFMIYFLCKKLHPYFYFFIFINILLSSYIFVAFLLLPFEKIKNEKYISIIKQITSFTGGIYYHISLNYLYNKKFKIFENRNILYIKWM